MIKAATLKLIDRENLTADESRAVMDRIMSGEGLPVQMAAYLTALRQKGETPEEILGSAQSLRDKVTRVEHHQEILFDNCGTGGDGAGTFNISTTAAFVLAACGLAIGKHGNRSVSSRCGSADLLATIGANLSLTPEQLGRCIDEIGIGFLFAQNLHPAMKNVAPIRKDLGFRTIFNLLGPLTNPASATHQLIGVFDCRYVPIVARAARSLGVKRVLVVHNRSGIDELTTSDRTDVCFVRNGTTEQFLLDPADYQFARCSVEDLRGGSPEENAGITRSVLGGDKGPKRDTVVLNAAVALWVAEKTASIEEGIAMASEAIDSGRALKKLNSFVQFTKGFQNA
jgi:anthranilate phosphoribosyltransferase